MLAPQRSLVRARSGLTFVRVEYEQPIFQGEANDAGHVEGPLWSPAHKSRSYRIRHANEEHRTRPYSLISFLLEIQFSRQLISFCSKPYQFADCAFNNNLLLD